MPKSLKNKIPSLLLASVVGMSVGLTLITLPAMLHGAKTDSFMQLFHDSLKNDSPIDAALTFAIAGMLWGLLVKSPYSICAVLVQPSGLVLLAIIELIRDPTSHNLLPFEFIVYFGLWICGLFGLLAGILIRNAISRLRRNLHMTP